MKRVLVTGGAGFIGSNLVKQLLADGAQVTALVHPHESLWRLTPIAAQISVVHADLCDHSAVADLVARLKPDTIFHMASFGGLPDQQDAESVFRVNFDATRHLLDACVRVGFDCFINTGSSSEYGIKAAPMAEHDCLEPVSDYGVAKAASTLYAARLARQHRLPIYTVRPFAVYGDYEQPSRLIPDLLAHVQQGVALELSAPHYVRDFIYVTDLVQLYTTLAEKKPAGVYVFNAGTGIETSIGQLIQCAGQLWPEMLQVLWGRKEPRPWEPAHWCADTTLVRKTLGWQATTTLEQGLKATYTWMSQHNGLYQLPGAKHESAGAAQHGANL